MLGEAGHPAEEVYGLAFTIVYDTAAVEPGTTFASFGNSWMGQLYTNLLGLNRDRYEDGRIDVALTRIDGENISGYGPIAQLHITIQDVIFMRSADYEMFFQIENVRLINKMEDFLPVQSPQTIALVEDAVSSTAKLEVADGVEVFPVPAREVVYLRSPESPIQAAELLSLDGRSLARFQQPKEIPLAGLPDGAYLLRVWTERGLSVHRVVVAGW
ncbi:MAG: T9SS type A sorting domain-containing protein, partial [Phaeodactylibacter sp.]|nr:T9SS type A sorting domain-containing protein [Phaeodactylibacter sp.]